MRATDNLKYENGGQALELETKLYSENFLLDYSIVHFQEHMVVQSLRASISQVSGALEWGVCDHTQRGG